jgi:Fe-S cluster assembly protein SufD
LVNTSDFKYDRRIMVEQGCQRVAIDEQSSLRQSTEVVVHDGAELTLLYDQINEDCLETSYHFDLGHDARVTLFIFLQKAEQYTLTCDIFLQKPGAQINVYGIYVLNGKQKVEVVMNQRHRAPQTTSNVIVKGILLDEAKASFNGTISVAAGAHNSNAVLQNKNLVLGAAAQAVSNPCLEVLADAVQCKHGSAIGNLDDEHLFYLQSRGFSVRSAESLLRNAFVQEIIARVPDQAIRERWQKRVELVSLQKS